MALLPESRGLRRRARARAPPPRRAPARRDPTPRSRRSPTSSPRTSRRSDPQRDARTVFGVLLGGFHDVVLGRVDDVGEYADYLYGFCARRVAGAMTATLLPDPEPRTRHYTIISVDDHLIEPARPVRGPHARAPRRPRAARRHARQRARDVGLRGSLLPAGRVERGRRTAEGGMEHGTRALRRDAQRLLRHRRACRRHGPRRRVRERLLPVPHRRLRRHGVLREQGPRARARGVARRGTTGTSRSGRRRTRTGSSRCSSPGSAIRRSRRPTSGPTRHAASRPSASPRTRSTSSSPRSTPITGTRCCARARRPRPCSACTTDRRRGPRRASPGAPLELYTSLFPVNALVTAADWLWARVPTRFPDIKIAFSEGGISWVPMLIDRIAYVLDHSAVGADGWDDPDGLPDRRAAPQLLVLRDRRRIDDRVARAHRHRPHLPRERLSARRFDLARHASARARRSRPHAHPTRSAS